MTSDTKFAQEINWSTQDIKEARDFLATHEVQEVPVFMEALVHSYDAGEKSFRLSAEGQQFRLTRTAYMEFCGTIGIPGKFADRIPNDLLIRCVDEMLDDTNDKVRLLVRDRDVICGVKRDSFIHTNPRDFLSAADGLLNSHQFREANVSDEGTSLLFEPMANQMIAPNVVNPDDRYNIGITFQLGYDAGLLEAHPYSLRHVCTNVAVTRSEAPKYRLVEKVRRASLGRYYSRLLENYESDRYVVYTQELSNRIARAINEPLTDWNYVRAFGPTAKLLGKEVALALIGVDEDKHNELMQEIKFKKAREEWRREDSTALDGLALYDVFNSLTAAAKGYSGAERSRLQEIGGELL